MRFVRMDIKNHPLFTNDFSISTLATDRVTNENLHNVIQLRNHIYLNNKIVLSGCNATGKTTVLEILKEMLKISTKTGNISQSKLNNLFWGEEHIIIVLYFYTENHELVKEELIFNSRKVEDEIIWFIENEKYSIKKVYINESRTNFFSFDDDKKIIKTIERNKLDEEETKYLKDDVSIFFMQEVHKKRSAQRIYDTLNNTENNFFNINKLGPIPIEILNFFDDNIELLSLNVAENTRRVYFELKLRNHNEVFTSENLATLQMYLSAGTIRGITIITKVLDTIRNDGILIIDEIENHLNKSIIKLIIDLFNYDSSQGSGTLIFTTHFSEILDYLPRADNIYINTKDDHNLISTKCYSAYSIRPEYSRQKIYDAAINMSTAPKYDYYMKLTNWFKQNV